MLKPNRRIKAHDTQAQICQILPTSPSLSMVVLISEPVNYHNKRTIQSHSQILSDTSARHPTRNHMRHRRTRTWVKKTSRSKKPASSLIIWWNRRSWRRCGPRGGSRTRTCTRTGTRRWRSSLDLRICRRAWRGRGLGSSSCLEKRSFCCSSRLLSLKKTLESRSRINSKRTNCLRILTLRSWIQR